MSFIPEKHLGRGGRSTVFAANTPIDAIFSSFLAFDSASSEHLNLGVASPVSVVAAIADAMFENKSSPARSVGNNSIIRIATLRSVHPDSVRMIASTMFKYWKAGVVPFIVFVSFHVPDVSLPLSANTNSSNRVCIDYRSRPHYDPLRHIASLECDDEAVCSDATNYIYKPTVQPELPKIRIVISSYGSMYNAGQTKKLKSVMNEVRAFDAAWVASVTKAMEGRMTSQLVGKLCLYIAAHVEILLHADVELSFSMRREGSLVRLSLPFHGEFDYDGPSIDSAVDAIKCENKVVASCIKCDLRHCVIRCPFCDDLRYCTRECALADETEHTKTCRVYIRRNAVEGPRAPGGVIVMKEVEKKESETKQ